MPDWHLVVIGDLETPHHAYRTLDCVYIHPEDQQRKYPALSDTIGWNTIQRRNIGFVEAYHAGATVVATVDDDNIPYDNWGKNLAVGREVMVDLYEPETEVFDPLSVTHTNHLWHRGFPLELLERKNETRYRGKIRRRIAVQADLWNGDPDIDAIARLTYRPDVSYEEITELYASDTIAPFNSQNTFIERDLLPYYAVFPHVGRMDDIWGAYFAFRHMNGVVAFGPPSVYQARNRQDVIKNLEDEVLGYRHTLDFVRGDFELPTHAREFYDLYRECFP